MPSEKTEAEQLKEFELAAKALAAQITGPGSGANRELLKIRAALAGYKKILIVVILALVLSLTGGAALGIVAAREGGQQKQLTTIQNRLAKRSSVLCPLYTIFLQSDTPENRKLTPPDQKALRDRAFKIIRQGYITLECKPLLTKDGQLPSPAPQK